jgi:hypothetical protein
LKDSQTKDYLFAVLDFSEFKEHMLDQSYFTPKKNIILYHLIKRTANLPKVDIETSKKCFEKAINLKYLTLRDLI